MPILYGKKKELRNRLQKNDAEAFEQCNDVQMFVFLLQELFDHSFEVPKNKTTRTRQTFDNALDQNSELLTGGVVYVCCMVFQPFMLDFLL